MYLLFCGVYVIPQQGYWLLPANSRFLQHPLFFRNCRKVLSKLLVQFVAPILNLAPVSSVHCLRFVLVYSVIFVFCLIVFVLILALSVFCLVYFVFLLFNYVLMVFSNLCEFFGYLQGILVLWLFHPPNKSFLYVLWPLQHYSVFLKLLKVFVYFRRVL